MLGGLQKLGPPGAPSDGSRGAGNNPPVGVGTTLLVYCSRGPAFGAGVVAGGLFALRGSESHCVSAGRHGFVSAFLYSHFLKHPVYDYLHRKQETRKMRHKNERSNKHTAEKYIDLPSFGATLQPGSCKSSRETPRTSSTRCFLSCS